MGGGGGGDHGHGHGGNGNGHGAHGEHGHAEPGHPRRVWTPSGGWGNEMPAAIARPRVAYGLAALAVTLYGLFEISRRLERRPQVPWRPIPSQSWSTHTREDDPDYSARVAAYRKSQKPLWRRLFWNQEDDAPASH